MTRGIWSLDSQHESQDAALTRMGEIPRDDDVLAIEGYCPLDGYDFLVLVKRKTEEDA